MNLKDIRTSKGFSRAELATLSGVPASTINAYERGQKSINKASGLTLYRLSKALNCTMEDLLEYELLYNETD